MDAGEKLRSSNPFPGLRPFATDEADRFFGRRQQIDELLERLQHASFVAVAGSSGCGKSSLVRAGLLHALTREGDGESCCRWRAAVLRPGNTPILNLAQQLAEVLDTRRDESRVGALYGQLRLGSLGLSEAVERARLGSDTRLLVVVDQFEEIFRFQRMTNPDEATAFVKLLLNAARDVVSPVDVVITLRSDSLGHAADFRELPETINCGLYLVPKLTREQRTEAIVKPVELRGYKVAPRLVQRLLNDVSDAFDDLPIMQHVLTRTWDRWAVACEGTRPIDLEDYEDQHLVGTAQRALCIHADEAYHSLAGFEPVAEKVFRALTERVAEGADARRPLAFDRLCDVVGTERPVVARVVDRFRRRDTAFLMPPEDVSLDANPVIDISHESLIRQWDTLREWAQAEAASRAMLARLVGAASDPDASLWRGADLEKAIAWRDHEQPTPAWVSLYVGGDGVGAWQSVERFLNKSDREVARERRRGWLQKGAVVTFVLALIAIGVAFRYMSRAHAVDVASAAVREMDRPAVSAHLAAEALRLDPSNDVAESALRQSLTLLETAHADKIKEVGGPVVSADYSRDGTRLVVATAKKVTILDAITLQEVNRIESNDEVLQAWLVGDKSTLVTQTYNIVDGNGRSHVQLQRLGTPVVKQLLCGEDENSPTIVAISADEQRVALGCSTGHIRVWNISHPAVPPMEFAHREVRGSITALTFSSTGEYLASGDVGGDIDVWKSGHAEPWIEAAQFRTDKSTASGGTIREVTFHPDSASHLMTAGDDNHATVWLLDLPNRRLVRGKGKQLVFNHDRSVIRARFVVRPERPLLVVTVSGKTAQLWSDEGGNPMQVRHYDWVFDANTSPNGELLVTASGDGTARVWSTRSGMPIAVLRGHHDAVIRAFVNDEGDRVTTASMDGTVRMWRVQTPRLLASESHWVLSAAFDRDASRVAVGREGGVDIIELGGAALSLSKTRHLAVRRPNNCSQFQVSRMSWSRDQKLLAATVSCYGLIGVEGTVVWRTDRLEDVTPSGLRTMKFATFSSATDDLIAVDEKGAIAIWNMAFGSNSEIHARQATRVDPLPADARYEIAAVSPNGKWLAATRSSDNSIALWTREAAQRGQKATALPGHAGQVRSLEFSADSKWLLSASADGTALMWLVEAPEQTKTLRSLTTSLLSSASFDASGRRVATASADGAIRVWDVAALKPKELVTLHWHNDYVNVVHFSPDGKSIVSASDDGTVKVGTCEFCNLSIHRLRDRVATLATLSQEEERDVRDDINHSSPFAAETLVSWRGLTSRR